MNTLFSRVAFCFMCVGAMLTTIMVSRYLTLDPDVYFPEQRETYTAHPIGIISHIVGGMVAMVLGPFQFIERLRKKKLTVHRWMGGTYLGGTMLGGGAGLYMAQFAHGGFPAGLGFAMLATFWMFAGVMALVRVLSHDFAAHREWMIRSYALTLAALSLRIYLPVYQGLSAMEVVDFPFTDMYIAVAWLAWVPNLILAEWFINASRARRTQRA